MVYDPITFSSSPAPSNPPPHLLFSSISLNTCFKFQSLFVLQLLISFPHYFSVRASLLPGWKLWKMEFSMIFTVCSALLLLSSLPADAQTASPPLLSPTPAPAPAPDFVNLTDLLTVAGPFHTFLSYLQSTKVIDTFQNQANNTEEGVTIFVPKDGAFSAQKKPSLSNLTEDQLKSLILFHGLPHYYSLAEFRNLSLQNPIATFAGGQYSLNFTDVSGTIHIGSGWTNTKVSSSVHSSDPVAVYQVDKILLPEAIFGTDIPPTPAPAPAPDIAPTADAPSAVSDGKAAPSSETKPSSSHRIINWGILIHIVLAISGGFLF